ncbi:MAG: protein kinase, partial [Planctomycetota bacterium]
MAVPTDNSKKPRSEGIGTFGIVAVKLGFITRAQLEEALKAQLTAQKLGFRRQLGEILIKRGYLTEEQLQKVLRTQTVPRRIGEYEVLSKLGAGGMGAVYKAKQMSMDREVALKILAPQMAKDKDFRERFVREARAVAKLNHPHIVGGIDVGEADGFCYFAMEYVAGESLGQYMGRLGGKVPEELALEFARQMALALSHAHSNHILHRDVKPDNILLDKAHKIAKLADLGLARTAESTADDPGLTHTGEALGTPFYISPEQACGKSDLTPATDLYSLGATLYHVLSGKVPYDGPTAAAIMTRHVTDPVPSLQAVNPDITSGTTRIVTKLMQKDPENRYTDAVQLAKDIERIQQGETLERPRPSTSLKIGKAAKSSMSLGGAAPRPPGGPAKERSEKEEPGGGDGSGVPTRSFRRRRPRRQAVGLGGVFVLIAVLVGLLFFMMNRRKGLPRLDPPPPAPEVQPSKPAASLPPGERLPPAVPASLQLQADGRRVFRTDFEGKVENFEVDPLIGRLDQYPTIVADEAGKNHALRLAPIRQPYRSAPNEAAAGVMARLLLAPDTVFSPNATLTARVFFSQCADPDPELRVFWAQPARI